MTLSNKVSLAFAAFFKEVPTHAQAWMRMVKSLAAASALDQKTQPAARNHDSRS